MSDKRRALTIGVVIGFLPTLGVAWAFAVKAAESVVNPHLASARTRVHLMCTWAKIQDENTRAICDQVGARCQSMDARVLLEGCNEDDKK